MFSLLFNKLQTASENYLSTILLIALKIERSIKNPIFPMRWLDANHTLKFIRTFSYKYQLDSV